MQHPLRILDLARGDDTRRLAAGFLVAVADEAVETDVMVSKELALLMLGRKVFFQELTSTVPKAPQTPEYQASGP